MLKSGGADSAIPLYLLPGHRRKAGIDWKRLKMSHWVVLKRLKIHFVAPKIISWGSGMAESAPPPLDLWDPKNWDGRISPPPDLEKNRQRIVLNVVLSNYNQLHRDQRPQISGITCLTRFFWIFGRKFFFLPKSTKSEKISVDFQLWPTEMRPVANVHKFCALSRGTFGFSRFEVVFEFYIPQNLASKGSTLMVKIGFWNKNFLEALKILGILPWLTLQ